MSLDTPVLFSVDLNFDWKVYSETFFLTKLLNVLRLKRAQVVAETGTVLLLGDELRAGNYIDPEQCHVFSMLAALESFLQFCGFYTSSRVRRATSCSDVTRID